MKILTIILLIFTMPLVAEWSDWSQEDKDLFENLIAADIFITSEVSFSIEKLETPKIKIENADGNKCSRCWKILPEVKPEGLCNRCEDVVKIYCS